MLDNKSEQKWPLIATKVFWVTQEAAIKGHFMPAWAASQYVTCPVNTLSFWDVFHRSYVDSCGFFMPFFKSDSRDKLSFSDPAPHPKAARHCEEERSSDVAIPYGFQEIHGIATPACGLVRDDAEHLTAAVNDNCGYRFSSARKQRLASLSEGGAP